MFSYPSSFLRVIGFVHILRERVRRALAEPKTLRWRQQDCRGPDESRSRSLLLHRGDPHVLRSFIITDHDGGEADRIAELKRLPEPSSIAQNPYTQVDTLARDKSDTTADVIDIIGR